MINIEETTEDYITEDYIFGKSFDGRGGSKVETLPEGDALGEDDLMIFSRKLARGFRGAQSANNYVDWIKYNA